MTLSPRPRCADWMSLSLLLGKGHTVLLKICVKWPSRSIGIQNMPASAHLFSSFPSTPDHQDLPHLSGPASAQGTIKLIRHDNILLKINGADHPTSTLHSPWFSISPFHCSSLLRVFAAAMCAVYFVYVDPLREIAEVALVFSASLPCHVIQFCNFFLGKFQPMLCISFNSFFHFVFLPSLYFLSTFRYRCKPLSH